MNLEMKVPLTSLCRVHVEQVVKTLEGNEKLNCILNYYEDRGLLFVPKSLISWDLYLAESEQADHGQNNLYANRGYPTQAHNIH